MLTYISFILILLTGAFLCLILGRRPAANVIGATVSVIAGALGLFCGLEGLAGSLWDLNLPWCVPMGSLHMAMDGLSGFFLCVISLICALAGLYGGQYLLPQAGRKNLGASWCFYLLLFASMAVVVTARNAVLFLVAWETMSLTSFFLVMFEHERPETVQAGWTYLVATHLGTAFLLVMFLLLGAGGSLEFSAMGAAGPMAGVVFLLATIGFGTEAGFLPLHVWLPEAHPAAPSHVSAVMSGVMIKTGIYGLMRTLSMLGALPAWWGWTLVGIGVASGVMGVLLALAQHDLKRLLAYHSVENIGIVALGMGVGLLGLSTGNATMAILGFLGAMLHVLNHAVFKSLLFLGAGAVLHATGTREIDRLGGLMKRMGSTGATFLIASAAICGLPPLNGFVSEFCIYAGSLYSIASGGKAAWGGVAAVAALALIGALAAACFTKAFGIIFLGEPRAEQARHAHEAPWAMRTAMWILAGLCVGLGICGPLMAWLVRPAVEIVMGSSWAGGMVSPLSGVTMSRLGFYDPNMAGQTGAWPCHLAAMDSLWWLSGAGVVLAAIVIALAIARRRILRQRTVTPGVTWDCGYAAPTARMQYTASSFAMPIIQMFRYVLRPTETMHRPQGLFPTSASVHTHTDDPFTRRAYSPTFAAVGWLAGRLKWMQQGRNQLYVLYIALAVLALLIWKLGGSQ